VHPSAPEVRRVFDRVTQRASELGFDTETHDGYAISLLGGNTTNEQEVGLVSHLDVVPEGTGWSVDPYAPFERDGFVVGARFG
jgi:succinyl-diaminopimelate desuccinylase